MKGAAYDSKGESMAEMQKMQQNKAAKMSMSNTYLKKFKSHHAQSKLTAS